MTLMEKQKWYWLRTTKKVVGLLMREYKKYHENMSDDMDYRILSVGMCIEDDTEDIMEVIPYAYLVVIPTQLVHEDAMKGIKIFVADRSMDSLANFKQVEILDTIHDSLGIEYKTDFGDFIFSHRTTDKSMLTKGDKKYLLNDYLSFNSIVSFLDFATFDIW